MPRYPSRPHAPSGRSSNENVTTAPEQIAWSALEGECRAQSAKRFLLRATAYLLTTFARASGRLPSAVDQLAKKSKLSDLVSETYRCIKLSRRRPLEGGLPRLTSRSAAGGCRNGAVITVASEHF